MAMLLEEGTDVEGTADKNACSEEQRWHSVRWRTRIHVQTHHMHSLVQRD